jgi:VIT1/CCC1 family predicted Fe2+/Mn2+ transporter
MTLTTPTRPHPETHFTGSELVRDIVIGMSDGLTAPFALAAGLSGAVESSGIILTAGLAEVAAGAIASPKRASRSALTIALAYIAGGLMPLAPYFFFGSVRTALLASVLFTLLALLLFGYIKGLFTTGKPVRSAAQTVIVGGLAASAAFLIAKALG